MLQGVQAYCRARAVDLVVFSGRTLDTPYGFEYQNPVVFAHMHAANVDALVMFSGTQCIHVSTEEFVERLASRITLPTVSVAVRLPGATGVFADNVHGLTELITHLIERHRCRTFTVIAGPLDNPDTVERLAVIRAELSTRGIDVPEGAVIVGDFSLDRGRDAMASYLARGNGAPDAVIAMNDMMAMGAVEALARNGYAVPGDVIVTGFDDVTRSRFTFPPLTTVSQDLFGQGWVAAERAHSAAMGDRPGSDASVDSHAVLRHSCGCLPLGDNDTYGLSVDGVALPVPQGSHVLPGVDRFMLEDDVFLLRRYLGQVYAAERAEECFFKLRSDLEAFDIKTCAIVLYLRRITRVPRDPFTLPGKACLEFFYDEGTAPGNDRPGTVFDPSASMLPEGLMTPRPRSLVVCALYHREEQLGYIVYELGKVDGSVYETLCVQIASMLNSAITIAEKEAVGSLLGDALTRMQATNRKLDKDSRTDELTGLMNRRGFLSFGQALIAQCLERGTAGLVVFGDMDGLKEINDTLGHDAGDRAIMEMAGALRKAFRSEDLVARLGGDEFAAVACDLVASDFPKVRERIGQALEEVNSRRDERFSLSISLGFVVFSREDRNLEHLLAVADGVLYEEKRRKHANP